jgi:hypothetical protein
VNAIATFLATLNDGLDRNVSSRHRGRQRAQPIEPGAHLDPGRFTRVQAIERDPTGAQWNGRSRRSRWLNPVARGSSYAARSSQTFHGVLPWRGPPTRLLGWPITR